MAREQRRLWTGLIGIAAIIAFDQLSKWIVMREVDGWVSLWDEYVRLTLIHNPGGAFGILADYGPWLTVLTVIVASGIVLALGAGRGRAPLAMAGLVAIAGGALGNLIDRLRFGYVIDFIDLGVSPTLRWPTFNLSDAAIVLGTAFVLWHLLRGEIGT